jgi:hypothetical protein
MWGRTTMYALVQFSVEIALRNSERIGPETAKLVGILLNGTYPLKYLRRVQGILRLHSSGKVSTAGLEYASRMGMLYGKMQFYYLQGTAEYFDKNGNKPSLVQSAPRREMGSMYLHNSFEREENNDQ